MCDNQHQHKHSCALVSLSVYSCSGPITGYDSVCLWHSNV
jgi:hypothetical protein